MIDENYLYKVRLESDDVCGTLAYFHFMTDATHYAEEQLKIYSTVYEECEIIIDYKGSCFALFTKDKKEG